MVLKRFKLHQVFDGVARTFSDPHYRKGSKNSKISAKKATFLVSSAVKTKFQHFWPPLEKLLEKSVSGLLEKILPTPMHTRMQNYTIFVKIALYCTI